MTTTVPGKATTKDGAEIYYESRGSGPVLLVIGGAGSGAVSFTKIAPLLAEEFRFISYDRRGTIRSTGRTDHDLDMAQQNEDIVAVLQAAGESSAVVFASCGGASIGFDLVTRFPDYVDALIVHEPPTASVLPNAAEEIAFYQSLCDLNEREGPIPAATKFMEYTRREISPSFRKRIELDGDFILRREAMPMVRFTPDVAAIRSSRVPLVMAAGEDSLAGGYGYARTAPILAEMFGCELVLFPGHHTSYVYHAEDFASALAATVRKVSSGNSTAAAPPLTGSEADLLRAERDRAVAAGRQGDARRAVDLLQGLLHRYVSAYGGEHIETLLLRDQLARWTGESGQPVRACEQFREQLPDWERIIGPEHPQTLRARHSLAYWTGESGNAVAAAALSRDVLRLREKVLGVEDSETLASRHGLAYWTAESGNPASAVEMLAELLPVRERVRGARHPDTLTTRHELARRTGEAGDPVQAVALFQQILPLREEVLGAEHPHTLTTRHEYGKWTGKAGDTANAVAILQTLVPVRERIQGERHPRTLTTRHELAVWTAKMGDRTGAAEMLHRLLPVRQQALGAEHPHTIATRNLLDACQDAPLCDIR